MKNKLLHPIKKILNFRSFRTSFQKQLLVLFFLLAVPILTVVCLISMFFLTQSSDETTRTAQTVTLEKIHNQLQYISEDTENLSKDIIFNDNVQSFFAQNYAGELYPDERDTAYFINNFIANRDFIDSVILLGTDKTLYSTEKAFTNVSDFETITQQSWYEEMVNSTDSYHWVSTKDGLMLCRTIYNLQDYKTLYGYVIIYLNDDYINDIWRSAASDSSTTTNLILMDDNNNILLRNDHAQNIYTNYSSIIPTINVLNNCEITYFNQQKYMVGSQDFPEDDWLLYMITPYKELNSSSTTIQLSLLAMIGIIIAVLFFIARFYANAMAKPIVALSSTMDTFHGGEYPPKKNFPAKYYEDREDEIGIIYRSYEQLTDRMDTLIQEIYIKQLEKRDAELALLQSQINPHFLYNTLDSINWLAMANEQDEISEMVMALSDTFRLSLMKSKSPYIPLSHEIEYITSYLTLQKFRYNDRLSYHFDIAEDTLDMPVLKFILQPIIENSLKHGIDHLAEGGDLTIRSRATEDALYITVINDGDGLDLKKMKELLVFDPDRMEFLSFLGDGYGLQNIHRRIRIVCGKAYGLSFDMREHEIKTMSDLRNASLKKETLCTIKLPLAKDIDYPTLENEQS